MEGRQYQSMAMAIIAAAGVGWLVGFVHVWQGGGQVALVRVHTIARTRRVAVLLLSLRVRFFFSLFFSFRRPHIPKLERTAAVLRQVPAR